LETVAGSMADKFNDEFDNAGKGTLSLTIDSIGIIGGDDDVTCVDVSMT
jgi:hypothetical protein